MQCPHEYYLRARISTTTQSLLLVLRSARALHVCTRWYAQELQQLFTISSTVAPGVLQLPGTKDREGMPFPASLKEMCGRRSAKVDRGLLSMQIKLLAVVVGLDEAFM